MDAEKPILDTTCVQRPEVEVISCQVGGKDPEAFFTLQREKHCLLELKMHCSETYI